MKKQRLAWIIVFSVLGVLTLISFLGLRFLREFKFAIFSLVVVWGIVLTVYQILQLKEFKKLMEADMPLFLAELLNSGIITKEQCLNPTQQEKNMFMAEHMGTIRKKRFFIAVSIIVAIYGVTLFFLF